MLSSVSASSSSTGSAARRTIFSGSAGSSSALASSATPPPIRASTKRAPEKPSLAGCSTATRTAEIAAWVAKIWPEPRKTAAPIASRTTRASGAAPGPTSSTRPSAIAMPTATPSASSTARRPRWPTVIPSVMIAATGAKNGRTWPTTSVAIR